MSLPLRAAGSLLACLAISLVAPLGAAEADAAPVPHNQDSPPGPALSPQEAIARMKVPEGFVVELVAAEPDLVNPVAMAFDERGRIWVTESFEYPRLTAGRGKDRVKILDDTDGDGRVDKVSIFAEGLNIPSGIAVGRGGVWVANAPDLLLLRDEDGDDRADRTEVVISGFGREDTHELPSALTWGPDGWLYGLNGVFNTSAIRHQGREHQFTCALWRLEPRSRAFEVFCEGTSNPWGLAFDGEGSAFVSACVIDHLWHLVESGYYHRQAGAYPRFTWKIESIVDHAHQKAAYCGLVYHDSEAYPPQYRGRLFMGNIHGNCLNVDRLDRRGSTYAAHGEDDFLTANDAWFMPVAQKTGPDGSLYVLDWYDRYHCYQDAMRDQAGIDRGRGRLYRIRYRDTPRAAKFDLSKETDSQLLARLDSDNIYYRETAQRILAERDTPRLEAIAIDPAASLRQRRHALWARMAQGPLRPHFLAKLVEADDSVLRAFAIRAAGQLADGALAGLVDRALSDSSPDVRLQAVVAIRKLKGPAATPALVAALASSGDDPLLPRVIWQNLHPLLDSDGDVFVEQMAAIDWAGQPAFGEIATRACERLLASQPPQIEAAAKLALVACQQQQGAAGCLAHLAALPPEVDVAQFARLEPVVGEILARRSRDDLELAASRLAARWDWNTAAANLRELAADSGVSSALRRAALETLIVHDESSLDLVARQLPQAEGDWQRELVRLLTVSQSPRVAALVLEMYPRLAPAAQTAAIDVLVTRAAWARQLLEAIGAKRLPAEALGVNHARALQSSPEPGIAEAVARHWGAVRTDRDPAREQVVADWTRRLAEIEGNAERGRASFAKHCAACHRVAGEGFEVGPDISRSGQASGEQLISNVLDPSLVIGAAYQSWIAVTTDGRVLLGLLAEDSPERIVLKQKGGESLIVPRSEIDELTRSSLSLMPEDFDQQLTPQELADLLAYLRLAAR